MPTFHKLMFHTQEKRRNPINSPILCVADNAWLGEAHYFWYYLEDAVFWGQTSKRRTGYFEVYSATIISEKILDTVFNEDHYLFWVKQVEKVANLFVKKAKTKPTLKEINDFFYEKGIWSQFDGIMFQDISNNQAHYLVKDLQYRKRIQLAVYNTDIIANFALHYEGQCI